MPMSAIPSSWELISVVCKLVMYLGAACSLGGAFCLFLYGDGRRATVQRVLLLQLFGALLSLQAVVISFLAQVGLINNAGVGGALDWTMAQILMETPLGDLSLYRLLGFAVLICSAVFFYRRTLVINQAPARFFYLNLLRINGIGFMLLLWAFRFGGHVSVLATPVQLALAVHFTVFALWIGSLYPLLLISNTNNLTELQLTLDRFSRHAIVIVIVLLIAGGVLAINLVHSLTELVSTAYGRALMFKLFLVFALLGIATLNKFKLVPALLLRGSSDKFRHSVRIEILAASLLLLLTAYLSTVVGPMMH
jgi:putative copper resistance protein D